MVKMKVVLGAPGSGVAKVEPASLGAFSIQPEKVTCFPACDDELLGAWATSPTVTAHTIATRIRDRLSVPAGSNDETLLEEVAAEYRTAKRYR